MASTSSQGLSFRSAVAALCEWFEGCGGGSGDLMGLAGLVKAEEDVGHPVHAGRDREGVAAGFGQGCGPVGCDPGDSDVAFTMRQYVQTDLEVHRQVATTLAELILGSTAPGSGEMPVALRPEARSRSQIRAHAGHDKAPGH